MLKRIVCRLLGHAWEIDADRFEYVAHCPRCEANANLFAGRFARHQIDALLEALDARDAQPPAR